MINLKELDMFYFYEKLMLEEKNKLPILSLKELLKDHDFSHTDTCIQTGNIFADFSSSIINKAIEHLKCECK